MEFLFTNSSGTIYRAGPDLGGARAIADYAEQFTDLAVTGDGRVLACTFYALYELDLETKGLIFMRALSGSVNGLASDGRGRLYVGGGDAAIAVLNDRTFEQIDNIALPAGTNSAGDIAIRGDTLYYTSTNQRLLTIDLGAGSVTSNVPDGLSAAYALHVAKKDLYVYSGGSAYTIDPHTGSQTFAGAIAGIGQIWGAASVPGTLRGTARSDEMHCILAGVDAEGRGGADRILGSAGSNHLHGGAGADWLAGRGGRDTLIGGTGADRLSGGHGADAFIFRDGCGRDIVSDFRDDVDQLVLDDRLWGGKNLSRAEVVHTFAEVSHGALILSFGQGDRIRLDGFDRTAALADDLLIV